LQFGNVRKQTQENEKRAQKLLQRYQEGEKDSSEEEQDEKTAEIEEKALEDFIAQNHANYSKIDE
jgi:hypothetical protein